MLNLLRPHRRTASAVESGTASSTGGGIANNHNHNNNNSNNNNAPSSGRGSYQPQSSYFFHHHHHSHSQPQTTLHYLHGGAGAGSSSAVPSSSFSAPPPPPAEATLPPLNFGSPGLLGGVSPSGFAGSIGGEGFMGGPVVAAQPYTGTTATAYGNATPTVRAPASPPPRIGGGNVGSGPPAAIGEGGIGIGIAGVPGGIGGYGIGGYGGGIGGGGGGTTLNMNKALPAPPPPTPPIATAMATLVSSTSSTTTTTAATTTIANSFATAPASTPNYTNSHLSPAVASPGTSRPGTGTSAKNMYFGGGGGGGGAGGGGVGGGRASSPSVPQLTPLLTSFGGGNGSTGRNKEKEKDMGAQSSQAAAPAASSSQKRNAKLNLLNPMTLLMRRKSSQPTIPALESTSRKAGARALPDDFDPGIIYGTRHPDWSSPGPKRVATPVEGTRSKSPAVNIRVMSPGGEEHVERQRTPLFKEHFEDNPTTGMGAAGQGMSVVGGIKPQQISPPVSRAQPIVAPTGPPPPAMAAPEMRSPLIGLSSPAISMGTTLVERSPIDPSPALVQQSQHLSPPPPSYTSNIVTSISRASSSSSSSSPSEIDETDPRMRSLKKGVTLVDHPLSLPRHLMNNSSRFSFEASSAAGSSPGLEDEGDGATPIDTSSVSKEGTSPDKNGAIGLGLGLGGMANRGGNAIMMNPNRKIFPQRQPARWSNSDLDDEDIVDMGSYEDDDDDLYYDDGIILGDDNDGEEQGFDTSNHSTLGLPSTIDSAPPRTEVPPIGSHDGALEHEEEPEREITTLDLPPTIGGIADKNGPTVYPPFMNPAGAGLDYQQQLGAFYANNGIPHQSLPLALQTLNHSLCKFQQEQAQQQREHGHQQDELDSPAPGFGNEIDPAFADPGDSYYPTHITSGFDDEDDLDLEMDNDMVEAANAEALEYDTDGIYGQEFGFYSASNVRGTLNPEQLVNGGYFGDPGYGPGGPLDGNGLGGPNGNGGVARPFLVRRPSLTPISERSECSYRNSMVFAFDPPGSRGGGGPGGAPSSLGGGPGGNHPLSLAGLTLDSPAGEASEEMSLSQLLRLRRSWGGGSQGPSAPSSPGGYSNTGGGGGGYASLAGGGGQSPIAYEWLGASNSAPPAATTTTTPAMAANTAPGGGAAEFNYGVMTPGMIQRQIDEMNQNSSTATSATSPQPQPPQGYYFPMMVLQQQQQQYHHQQQQIQQMQNRQLQVEEDNQLDELQQYEAGEDGDYYDEDQYYQDGYPEDEDDGEYDGFGGGGEEEEDGGFEHVGAAVGGGVNGGGVTKELEREPSAAGKQSIAGDSSYASALGSPIALPVEGGGGVGGDGRRSLEEGQGLLAGVCGGVSGGR
ncbi:hypothetical protein DFH27DRAFT_211901 [Peziza echinospora]|nr:hypothetical protein DFH27DRAFT_211901 [Peziza echinospora]